MISEQVVQNGHNKPATLKMGKLLKKSSKKKKKAGIKASAKKAKRKPVARTASKHKRKPTTRKRNRSIESVYAGVGQLIAKARTKMKWSQAQMAKHTAFSRVSIALIETGKQRVALHDLSVFAKAFKTKPANLIPSSFLK